MESLLVLAGIVVPFGAVAALSNVESDSRLVQAAIAVAAVALLLFVAFVVTR